jgi:hypothetical protein
MLADASAPFDRRGNLEFKNVPAAARAVVLRKWRRIRFMIVWLLIRVGVGRASLRD